jgi:hypothetical protein
VPTIFVSVRSRSLCFGEIVSGAKPVRLQSFRNKDPSV